MRDNLIEGQLMFWWHILTGYAMTVNLIFPISWSVKLTGKIVGSWYRASGYFLRHFLGIDTKYYGDRLQKENAIYICNHRSEIEYKFIWSLVSLSGMGDTIRFVGKDVLKHAPGFGWMSVANRYIFLKRNWETDQKYLDWYFENKEKINQLFIYPEGTTWGPDTLDRRNKWLKECDEDAHQFIRVLPPKIKGFEYFLDKSDAKAVYDFTVRFVGLPEESKYLMMSHLFWGKVPSQVEVHIKRHDISEVSGGDWLHERYVEKDSFLTEDWSDNHEQIDVLHDFTDMFRFTFYTSLLFLTWYGLTSNSLYSSYFLIANCWMIGRSILH